jgi:hypothetical protein
MSVSLISGKPEKHSRYSGIAAIARRFQQQNTAETAANGEHLLRHGSYTS